MSVSKEDREAYEQGLGDSKKSSLEIALDVQSGLVQMLTYSESQHAAYEKGLRGEQLDADKKDDSDETPSVFDALFGNSPSSGSESSREEASSSTSESASSEEEESDSGGSYDSSYEDSSSYSYTPSSPAPASSSESWLSTLIPIAAFIGVILGIGIIIHERSSSPTGDEMHPPRTTTEYYPQPRTSSPWLESPEEVIDSGACPFEGCEYGERWEARQDVDVYAAPPEALGTEPSSLRRAATVRAGEWITTRTGVILAKRLVVPFVKGRMTRGPVVGWPGQLISIYSYHGENCWQSWVFDRFIIMCDMVFEGTPQNEWWIQVEMANGSLGWTNSPQSFSSQERLDKDLSRTISDPELSLSDKLAKINFLLEEGANLDWHGGRHGVSPMEAAIKTRDTGLLKELMAIGLDIQSVSRCPAAFARMYALDPGGDLMLDFLLDNGLRLSCLVDPPLQAFLINGIALDSYPVDQAIKVAGVLIKRGASVSQRNLWGKSILDVLDEPVNASRPHTTKLKEALIELDSEYFILNREAHPETKMIDANQEVLEAPRPNQVAGFFFCLKISKSQSCAV